MTEESSTTIGAAGAGRQSSSAAWQWLVADDYEAMSRAAAERVAEEVRLKPAALLCLATGASPRRMYELMADQGRADASLYALARWMKLDEWGGLAMDDPGSCECYLRQILLGPLDVPSARYFGWNSQPADPETECRRVATWLVAEGPADIQVLGLGENGHLGFNEPADVWQTGPHVALLTASSLRHAMLGLSRQQVHYGLTLGVEDILRCRMILLLVSGEHKARQLLRLATQDVSSHFPASILRRHAAVRIFCDRAAAALLPPEMFATGDGSSSTPPPVNS